MALTKTPPLVMPNTGASHLCSSTFFASADVPTLYYPKPGLIRRRQPLAARRTIAASMALSPLHALSLVPRAPPLQLHGATSSNAAISSSVIITWTLVAGWPCSL
jgi:hypothetical protein